MAHGDYDCCAVCDTKMAYSHDATTKKEVCSECAVSLYVATGERITSGDALVDWITRTGTAAVAILDHAGYSKCYYTNPVDDAVNALRDARTPHHGGPR
jgi:hypothetical protein